MSLPLSLEIVAANISLDNNKGAILEVGEEGGKTKNASFSELRRLQLPGVQWSYMC